MSAVRDYYISPHAVVEGEVHFGTGCVVLAGARITASAEASLSFGNYCLVEEYAVVRPGEQSGQAHVVIGNYNVFRARSIVSDVTAIGEGNVFQSFCAVSGGAAIGDFNVFAAFARVDGTVVRAGRKEEESPFSHCTVMTPSPSTSLADTKAGDDDAATTAGVAVVVIPRYGSRSVAELPSMAQTLLAAVNSSSENERVGAAAATAELSRKGDEGDRDDSDGGEEFWEGDDHTADNGAPPITKALSSASASSVASDALDTVTPHKQRLTTQYLDVATPLLQDDEQRRLAASAEALSPAMVQAMLGALPEQTQKAAVQDAVKTCRYYLTLYTVL